MTVPDGAQRSEDGYYFLDGGDWKPVPEDDPQHPHNAAGAASAAATSAAAGAAGDPAGAGGTGAAEAAAGGAAAAAGGELTKADLEHITTEEQIDERAHPYFAPNYDAYPDDTSAAEASPDLSEPSGVS
jgi:hypothetical protein